MRRSGKEEKRERQRAMEGFYKNAALVGQRWEAYLQDHPTDTIRSLCKSWRSAV